MSVREILLRCGHQIICFFGILSDIPRNQNNVPAFSFSIIPTVPQCSAIPLVKDLDLAVVVRCLDTGVVYDLARACLLRRKARIDAINKSARDQHSICVWPNWWALKPLRLSGHGVMSRGTPCNPSF